MENTALEKQKKLIKKRNKQLIALLFVAVICAIISLTVGSAKIGVKGFFSGLLATDDYYTRIVWNIRMPRVLAAVVCGFGLGAVGCVMQSVLSNPMASPSTLGVSNAAIFGANFAIIVLGGGTFSAGNGESLTLSNPYLVSSFAFVFAMLSSAIFLFVGFSRRAANQTVVLAGLAVGTVFSSATTLLQFFAVDTRISAAIFWSFGDLGRASYPEVLALFVCVFSASTYFMVKKWSFVGLAQGETVAASLGIKTKRLKITSIIFCSLIVGLTVSFFGVIGFIGLVAPHIVKLFIKDDFGYVLPMSGIMGAVILLISDTLSRTVLTGISLPVGAITSLLGGPVFLWLLLKRENKI